MASRKDQPDKGGAGTGIGRVMRSLGDLLEIVSDLAEEAEGARGEVTRSGEVGGEGKGVKAAYGFSVRVGGGEPRVTRSGDTERDGSVIGRSTSWPKPPAGRSGDTEREGRGFIVEERREPVVEVFDEGDHLLVVAELPGVTAHDIHIDVRGDVLSLRAACGDRNYKAEIKLPAAALQEGAASSYRGGVLELKLPKTR